MGRSKKKQQDKDVQVTFYDTASHKSGQARAAALASKSSSKDTVNLCIKERKGMPVEIFFLVLAAVLLVLVVVEYFGVYRPYRALERLEKQLEADQATLQQVYDGMKDRDTVRENYRKYNYENFPFEIVDREEVLDLIEDVVFGSGKIQNVSVAGNTLTLTITEVLRDASNEMQSAFRASDLVFNVIVSRTNLQLGDLGETATVNMTVIFKDAVMGGN